MDEVARVEKLPPSCSNCRKRKSRCSREQPCSQCVKSKLRCTYDKVSRTPLTRKYLTSIEHELARTKALLQESEGHAVTNDQHEQRSSSSYSTDQNGNTERYPTDTPMTSIVSESNNLSSRPEKTRRNNVASLETAPAGDLDWDERGTNPNSARFNDGMASLIDRNGYMGVASGAALLRMADDGSGEEIANGQVQASNSASITPPLLPALYSLAQLEPWVDSYFATYHISYPIVHEPTFRAQFMEVIARPNGQCWQVLLYIIAAIGSFAASECSPEVDIGLFEAARQRMSIDMLETGNLTLVQALTLISNYVQKRNRPNSGYNYMGLAKRMAWGLALHKEFPTWREQPFRLEIRRRVWWCLYIFDVGAIITFSRPLDMPSDGIEIGLPLNVNDSAMTQSTNRVPSESDSTTLYTHVRCQSQFHLATNHIYQRLISVIPSPEEMHSFDENNLQGWLSNLPHYFTQDTFQLQKYRLCHAILQWRWRNFRILMFRPYLMRRFVRQRQFASDDMGSSISTPAEELAIQKCLDTAKESIQIISTYWKEGTQNVLTCWYGLYFIFQAVLIPVVSLRNNSYSEAAPSWRDTVLLALDTISDMNRLNSAAARCHTAITKLCGAYLAMDISQWESPTHESPQTQMNTLYSYMFGPMTDSQLFDLQDFQMQESSFMDFMGQLGAP